MMDAREVVDLLVLAGRLRFQEPILLVLAEAIFQNRNKALSIRQGKSQRIVSDLLVMLP
jgi:hypothetical protein